MNSIKFTLAVILVLTLYAYSHDCISGMTSEEIESKVSALLSKMTLEEKIGQMTQVSIQVATKQEGTVVQDHKVPYRIFVKCL